MPKDSTEPPMLIYRDKRLVIYDGKVCLPTKTAGRRGTQSLRDAAMGLSLVQMSDDTMASVLCLF